MSAAPRKELGEAVESLLDGPSLDESTGVEGHPAVCVWQPRGERFAGAFGCLFAERNNLCHPSARLVEPQLAAPDAAHGAGAAVGAEELVICAQPGERPLDSLSHMHLVSFRPTHMHADGQTHDLRDEG